MLSISRFKPRRPRLGNPNHARGLTRLGLWSARGLALLWAAIWIAFTASVVWGQPPLDLLVGVASGAMILVPVIAAWALPRFGGLILLALGVLVWLWADSEASRVGVIVPALGLGSAFLALGTAASWQRWRTRRKALKIARKMERAPAAA